MKAHWQNPVYRAKMKERDEKREQMRLADPEKFSRAGVPNGMRKDEAKQKWAIAERQADQIIKTLKAAGVLPETATAAVTEKATATVPAKTVPATAVVAVPATEDEMAEATLREVFKLAIGPTGTRAKLSALDTILKYTRLKPMSVLKLALGDAESALDEMVG
jgi:hypothetical protein